MLYVIKRKSIIIQAAGYAVATFNERQAGSLGGVGMGNFITEDDIEQAILAKLQAPPFAYNILRCPASPDMRDDLQDGTGRSSKKECILP